MTKGPVPKMAHRHEDPRLQAILDSYERWLGHPLCTLTELEDAPFAVLAHGTEPSPVLYYGNRTALSLWEMSFQDFTRMPSAQTAESALRDARERLLREVDAQGYSSNYCGVRVSSTGRRFEIQHATVWNVLSPTGDHLGQAATFASWRYL